MVAVQSVKYPKINVTESIDKHAQRLDSIIRCKDASGDMFTEGKTIGLERRWPVGSAMLACELLGVLIINCCL